MEPKVYDEERGTAVPGVRYVYVPVRLATGAAGVLIAFTLLLLGGLAAPTVAQNTTGVIAVCNEEARADSEAAFLRLQLIRRVDPGGVTADELSAAAANYIAQSEACYQELVGRTGEPIDDGGVWLTSSGAVPFNTNGRKWGPNSPFTGGQNVAGPGTAGGTVTYSFMPDGVDLSAEGGTPGTSVAVTSLTTFSACFLTEFTNAFAAWSAVADIQFVEVADNGLPFNTFGATGDIRFAGHIFDGPSSVLAHQFFPPPNGVSGAGDGHFDVAENWTCTPGSGGVDIGIVAIHEIGHGIGLNHEPASGNTAIMNPFYSPGVASVPLADDIVGAVSIYGTAATCTFSISPTSATVAASDTTGSVSVTAPSGCAWLAVSNDAFVTVTGGAGGSGSGTVSYSVATNAATSQRTGTITIDGLTFTVTQRAAFTDDPLTAGTTQIKAVHISELRTRVNALRTACGLGNASFTDDPLTAGVTTAKAVHVNQLRTALNDAFVACGQTAPFSGMISVGTVVTAAQVAVIRTQVVTLEG